MQIILKLQLGFVLYAKIKETNVYHLRVSVHVCALACVCVCVCVCMSV